MSWSTATGGAEWIPHLALALGRPLGFMVSDGGATALVRRRMEKDTFSREDMRKAMLLVAGVLALAAYSTPGHWPYTELVPEFSRKNSSAVVRRIPHPTLANLDFAAYNDNPVRFNPAKERPKKPEAAPTLAEAGFGGLLKNPVDRLSDLPLSDAARRLPMAFVPLSNKLFEVTKSGAFSEAAARINVYKWADPSIHRAYQEVVSAYLHEGRNGPKIFVEVEFAAWVAFAAAFDDDDGDGFREIYGELNLGSLTGDTLARAAAWMKEDYLAKVLDKPAMVDWINTLASYWYPSLNTDLIDMSQYDRWPTPETEKSVVKKLKKLSVASPLAVVRGNPFGKPIYNVYVVEGIEGVPQPEGSSYAVTKEAPAGMDTALSINFKGNASRWAAELGRHGGFAAWAQKNSAYYQALDQVLTRLPKERLGFPGRDSWLFFGNSLRYITAGELTNQPSDKNPLPRLVELKELLGKNNVDFLFVPVPTKPEVYFEHLPVDAVPGTPPLIHPHGRKFLHDLQASGVEVVDLLPVFLKEKEADSAAGEKVYQYHDTHWTHRGVSAAAGAIANRIRTYGWYPNLEKRSFTIRDTLFERRGDIVERLPDTLQSKYAAALLKGRRVFGPDGKPFMSSKDSPVALIGDSFTGVFELTDCKSAGIGAHLAAETGLPVDIVTSWGGGPLVRRKFLRARGKALGQKRLVVYLMVARDLWDYSQSWPPLSAN